MAKDYDRTRRLGHEATEPSYGSISPIWRSINGEFLAYVELRQFLIRNRRVIGERGHHQRPLAYVGEIHTFHAVHICVMCAWVHPRSRIPRRKPFSEEVCYIRCHVGFRRGDSTFWELLLLRFALDTKIVLTP